MEGYKQPAKMSTYKRIELPTFSMKKVRGAKSVVPLPDETITLAGHHSVLRAGLQCDEKRPSPWGITFDRTIWIDKATMTVVKEANKEHSFEMPQRDVRIPEDIVRVTTYPVTELNLAKADEKLFSFTPPTEARRVDHFRPFRSGAL